MEFILVDTLRELQNLIFILIRICNVDISGTLPSPAVDASHSPAASSESSFQNSAVVPVKKHNHRYHVTTVQGVGIGIIGVAVLFLVILIPLILKKNRELKDLSVPIGTSWKALPPSSQKCQGGLCTCLFCFNK